jgi:hypothetical protein
LYSWPSEIFKGQMLSSDSSTLVIGRCTILRFSQTLLV